MSSLSFEDLVRALNFTDEDAHHISCTKQGVLKLALYQGPDDLPKVKVVGRVLQLRDGRFVYKKKVNKRKHLYRKLNAWGVTSSIIRVLSTYNVLVSFESGDTTYRIGARRALREDCQEVCWEGYEKQLMIPLYHWRHLPPG